VKPRLTFVEGVNGHVRARVATDMGQARALARELRDAGAEPLLQEHLQGQLMAFTALTDADGRIVAQLQQISERVWPPQAGISARARTVRVEPSMAGAVARLLSALEWFGLAQLQFIRGMDGTPRLIDFNGRFYGSLALSLAAGANLPAAWARLATGRPLEALPHARVGARYQWLTADLRASTLRGPLWRRAAGALGCIARAPACAHSVWSWRDPGPALAQLRSRLATWMRRAS
jgi:predicted ATP-grasp superfamily ATP-dependent carboligase